MSFAIRTSLAPVGKASTSLSTASSRVSTAQPIFEYTEKGITATRSLAHAGRGSFNPAVLQLKKTRPTMSNRQPVAYKNYKWIVADPQLLGGKLAIRGTRLA